MTKTVHSGRFSRHQLDLHVTLSGRHDLSAQIFSQIRAAILDGRLPTGSTIPSIRELAKQLSVSHNTISAAYDMLAAEGLTRSRVGKGTYVTKEASPRPEVQRKDSLLRPTSVWGEIPEPYDMSLYKPEFDFRTGILETEQFPFSAWRALLSAQFRFGVIGSASRIDPAGHADLRGALANHLGVARGIRADPADVIVTNGTQQAADLIARVVLEPRSIVAVEDPGRQQPNRLFTSLGAQVIGTPVDSEGLVVSALPKDAKIVYVTPSHQFPLGATMSMERRLALLEWAQTVNATIIEDDSGSEFRYGGISLDPLHRLDNTGRVAYVGSFSKALLPTLRLGFIVPPASLKAALRKAKYVSDWHTAVPMQAALARFITEGLFARHVRRMREIYAKRHYEIRAVLEDLLDHRLQPLPSAGGLHLAALLLPHRYDDRVIADLAHAAGVGIQPISQFAVHTHSSPGLVIGYGGIRIDQIRPGLTRLRSVLDAAP